MTHDEQQKKMTRVLVSTACTCERQVDSGVSVVWNNLFAVLEGCFHHENMIMSNWLSQRKLRRGHCRALHTVPREDTKNVISSLAGVVFRVFFLFFLLSILDVKCCLKESFY